MRLETDRLILRCWREADFAPFVALNADPLVMRYFASTRTPEACRDTIRRYESCHARDGFGFCAVERKADGAFIGVIGIETVRPFGLPFEPAVEVGWMLAADCWGRGYATEGARAAMDHGYRQFGLGEIIAVTAVDNAASRAVMVRLAMTTDPADDFDHPLVPEGHPLRHHVLYRQRRPGG